MTDTAETIVTAPKPVWMKMQDGDRLTFSEWFGYYISSPVRSFTRRCRATPALRERCVEYAIAAGATGANAVVWDSEKLVEFITQGKS